MTETITADITPVTKQTHLQQVIRLVVAINVLLSVIHSELYAALWFTTLQCCKHAGERYNKLQQHYVQYIPALTMQSSLLKANDEAKQKHMRKNISHGACTMLLHACKATWSNAKPNVVV